MAAELKIVVTGAEAAHKQLLGMEAAYERLANKAIALQITTSKKRLNAVKAEVDKIKAEYASIKDPLGGGGRGRSPVPGGGFPSLGGGGGSATGGMGGTGPMIAAGLALGALSKGIDLAVDALKAFAGFLVSDIVKPQMQLERFATQLENSTRGQVKAVNIMDKANSLQLKWNIDANQAAEAMGSLQDKTGRVELSMGAMDDLAQLTKAYGVELGDLVDYTAAVANLDPTMAVAEVLEVVKQSLAGGMEEGGKFTLREIARTGGAMFSKAAALSGSGKERAASLGAFVQTSGVTGKLDESITNANAFVAQVQQLSRLGKIDKKKVLTADSKQVVLDAALKEVLKGSVNRDTKKASAGKLAAMGLTDTSIAAVMPFFDKFAAALDKNGGNADKAAEETLEGYYRIRDATISETEVREAAAKVMATSAEKWDTAVNTVKAKLLAIMPQAQAVIDHIAEAAPEIGDMLVLLANVLANGVEWIAEALGRPEDVERVREFRARQSADQAIARAKEAGDTGEVARLTAERDRASAVDQRKRRAVDQLADKKSTRFLYSAVGIDKQPETDEDREKVRFRLGGMARKVAEAAAKGGTSGAELVIQRQIQDRMLTPEQADIMRQLAADSAEAGEKFTTSMAKIPDKMTDFGVALDRVIEKLDKIPEGPLGGGANGGKK